MAVLAVLFFWPAPMPSYAGRTVGQWFDLYTDNGGNNSPAQITNVAPAFTAMGTNAVPYLAGRITQPGYSAFTRWRLRNGQRIPRLVEGLLPSLPRSRFIEGMNARALKLGDVGQSAPQTWPAPFNEPARIHLIATIYATEVAQLNYVQQRALAGRFAVAGSSARSAGTQRHLQRVSRAEAGRGKLRGVSRSGRIRFAQAPAGRRRAAARGRAEYLPGPLNCTPVASWRAA